MTKLKIRNALLDDIPMVVRLLSNDPLGSERESYQKPLPNQYYVAFTEIDSDKNNFLMVVEDDNNIIGTMQLTILHHMTHQGGKRAQIEGVRIDENYRGKGIGKHMIEWAINKARTLGCHLVQLTTDKKRPEALKFYQQIGFVDSHEGLKFHLN